MDEWLSEGCFLLNRLIHANSYVRAYVITLCIPSSARLVAVLVLMVDKVTNFFLIFYIVYRFIDSPCMRARV